MQHGMFALLNDARASIRAHVSTILTGEEQMENTVAGFGERRAPTPATKPVRPRRAPRPKHAAAAVPLNCRARARTRRLDPPAAAASRLHQAQPGLPSCVLMNLAIQVGRPLCQADACCAGTPLLREGPACAAERATRASLCTRTHGGFPCRWRCLGFRRNSGGGEGKRGGTQGVPQDLTFESSPACLPGL